MKKLHEQAMDLLARREHSFFELERKLTAKGWREHEVRETVEQLAAEGLQSDERFTEMYVNSRASAGFGPRRIELELKQRGVADKLIDSYVSADKDRWRKIFRQVCLRKFGGLNVNEINNISIRARQIRFLLQRGFDPAWVYEEINDDGMDG